MGERQRRKRTSQQVQTVALEEVVFNITRIKLALFLSVWICFLAVNAFAGDFHVTVDFNDDFRKAGGSVQPENIDQLMARFDELGITRVYWIHNSEDHFLPKPLTDSRIDLFTRAAEAAHKHGMELYASFKPFETGRSGSFSFPKNIPLPPSQSYVEGIGGRHPVIAPFVLKHLEYRLRRKPDTMPVAGKATMIKLIKSDDQPTRIRKKDLRILSASINGEFELTKGDFSFRDLVEKRKGKDVRVLELSGLSIPDDQLYIMVECLLKDGTGDFRALDDSMIELYDENNNQLSITPDEGQVSKEHLESWWKTFNLLLYNNDSPPSVVAPEYGKSARQSAYHFDGGNTLKFRTLDSAESSRDGVLVAARGHNEYTIGTLHPAYPEVRKYWLDEIQLRCFDAGADGVSIRFGNHSCWTSRGDLYGFNQPVVDEYKQRYGVDVLTEEFDAQKWKDLQGEYVTLFLSELKQLTKKEGKGLQISVNYEMINMPTGWIRNDVPVNFTYDWTKWISEDIADSIELKYFPFPFRKNTRLGVKEIDQIAAIAHQYGKPIYSNVRLESRIPWWEIQGKGKPAVSADDERLKGLWEDMRLSYHHPELDGVILYEGAGFTKMDAATGETITAQFAKDMLNQLRKEAEKKRALSE